ncbi:baseplate J/gp47 family protein [Vibrio sp. OPT18]|uniref:baseplate J/gp47 family protein n=1 Tax=Vibrio sp. OPT18 TaxID=2778641 RepID=UPI00187E0D3F|nr:baseplate J/gp47 family protein [Vibrio sp. OPT18]MBE8578675.1 baseplate J/gp47 family protein [Vibrio sp. OPT18]
MSTQRSLTALIDRAKSTLIARTGQNNPAIDAIACAIAGVSYGQYGYQDNLLRELNPETCSESWLYLHAYRHKTPRLQPTYAKGYVQFEAITDVVEIPQETRFTLKATGIEYETLSTHLSNEPIEAMALSAGSLGNLPTGTLLSLTQALAGVHPDRVLCLGFEGGAELEDLERWRTRVVMAFSRSSLVGRIEDYEAWAMSAHVDVDYAWALDNTPSLGYVQVYIGTRSDNPLVSEGVVKIVQDYIDEERLAGCHPNVGLPTLKPIDIGIQNVDSPVIRTQVIVALKKFFQEKMGKRDKEGNLESITPTEIILAIASVTSGYILTSPQQEQFLKVNEIHTLGEVTWT